MTARSLARRVAALERRRREPPAEPARGEPRVDFDAMTDAELEAWLQADFSRPRTPKQEAAFLAIDELSDEELDRYLAWQCAYEPRGPDPLRPRVDAILQRKGEARVPERD